MTKLESQSVADSLSLFARKECDTAALGQHLRRQSTADLTPHAVALGKIFGMDGAFAILTAASDREKQAAVDKAKAESAGVAKPLRCKVSAKGALSVYGLSAKWPTTLYRGQWERLIAFVPEIEKFIRANSAALSVKASETADVETAEVQA